MKKLMLILAAMCMLLVAVAPAFASDDNHKKDKDFRDFNVNAFDRFDNDRFDVLGDNLFDDNTDLNQSNDQDVDSGNSNQTFTVVNTGDNANQCVGLQGVSNTGNQVSNNSVSQYGSKDAGVGIEGGDFSISPSNSTSCDQQVNQVATSVNY